MAQTIAVLCVLVLLVPSLAVACPGEHHLSAREVLGWWTLDPLVIGLLAITTVAYLAGTRALWRTAGAGHGVRPWHLVAFAAGQLVVALALLSPLDHLSDILFSAHMSQHELLMLAAAPLAVLGRPLLAWLWALPAGRRERVIAWIERPGVRGTWRTVTGPFFVLVLHALALWLWHIPVLFEAALASEALHAVQHACFFVTAALFWWALVHGRYGRIGYGVSVLYVFATAMHTSVLGVLFTVGRRVVYATHASRSESWCIAALSDQQLAGLIMWVPAGALLSAIGLALFAAWLGEAQRRGARVTRTIAAAAAATRAPAVDPDLASTTEG